MSLLPHAGAPLPVTHEPIPAEELNRALAALRALLGDRPATVELVQQAAQQADVSLACAYAALAFDPNLRVDASQETLIAICVGGCQQQGALANLEALLQERAARLEAGKPAFDLLPRSCLDMCPHSPVCLSRSKQGSRAHPRLRADDVPTMIAELCAE